MSIGTGIVKGNLKEIFVKVIGGVRVKRMMLKANMKDLLTGEQMLFTEF